MKRLIYIVVFYFHQSAVQKVNISGNVDNPEGTLDALMQIAVCGSVRLLQIFVKVTVADQQHSSINRSPSGK